MKAKEELEQKLNEPLEDSVGSVVFQFTPENNIWDCAYYRKILSIFPEMYTKNLKDCFSQIKRN